MPENKLLQIKQIMSELETAVEVVVKSVSVEILDELKAVTPVDTGFAQANWLATFGAPATRAVGAPGNPGPALSVQAAATAALQTYTLERGPVYIGNPTAYIGEIVAPTTATIAINQGVANIRFR